MMIRKVLPVLATLIFCGLIPASAQSGTAPHPVFYTNADNAEIHVKVGQTLNVSYCNPKPLPGRDCGGPFVKHQLDPYLRTGPGFLDTTGGGPWIFRIHSGFLPAGLVLHSNGLLTGTVSRINRLTRAWPFTICVTEFGHATSRSTKGRCDTATVDVQAKGKPTPTPTPAPSAHPFDGTWQGTFTGSITETEQPVIFYGPTTFDVNDGAFQVDITNGVLSFYGTTLSFVGEPQIGTDGSATLIMSIPGEQETGGPDVTPCQFAVQFSKTGTADGVGQLSCKYSYVAHASVNGVTEPYTITYLYTGLLHMTRTSRP